MKKFLETAALAALVCAVPAHAEDEEEIGILAALGLTAAEGKTEVSDKGAELEGWMLASGTLAMAAKAIAVDNKPSFVAAPAIDKTPARPLILLSGETKFDLGAYYSAEGNIVAARAQLSKAAKNCTIIGPAPPLVFGFDGGVAKNDDNSARLMNAIIGALKVDTKITGFDISTLDAALINLIANHLTSNARIPLDAIGSIDANSVLAKAFTDLTAEQMALAECGSLMSDGTAEEKKKKAGVEGAATAAAAVAKSLVAFDKDAGNSLLNRALLVEPYIDGKFDALRIKVEKGGGNLITRKNIFLQFGFRGALSLTAGTIVSYRYYTPSTGTVIKSGLLICRAAERDWHAVQAGNLSVEPCIDAATAAVQARRDR